MECRVCSDSLSALLDGEVTVEEQRSLEAHLAQCPSCREEFDSLAYCLRLTDALDAEAGLYLPPFSGIEDRIGSVSGSFWNLQWLVSPAWAALAAGLLLAVSLPLYWKSTDEEAVLQSQFTSFIQERDRQEVLHHGIIEIEPVGWVTYNPFKLEDAPARGNPFLE